MSAVPDGAPPRRRRVLDVSPLPTTGFGPHGLGWWGTVGFMLIEGTTLAIAAVTYLYVRKNFTAWPPPGVAEPSLLVGTLGLLLLLAVMVPMHQVAKAAKRFDLRRIRIWLLVALVMSLAVTVVRAFEFAALGVRWDANAYGSAAWTLLGLHTALLLVDDIETAAFAVLMFRGPVEKKHFADASDAALYQYFLSLVYVPVYVLVYLTPRWL